MKSGAASSGVSGDINIMAGASGGAGGSISIAGEEADTDWWKREHGIWRQLRAGQWKRCCGQRLVGYCWQQRAAARLDHLRELTPVTYLFRQGWRPQELVERLQ